MKKEFEKEFRKYLDNIEIRDEFIDSNYDILKKYCLSGGKRLRPLALIHVYSGYDKKIIPIAIAIELHHAYSLILDDIMDEDESRRGNSTVHNMLRKYYTDRYGEEEYDGKLFSKKENRYAVSFAIMIANIANILSKRLILESDFEKDKKLIAIDLMNRYDQEIYHGQMKDMRFEDKEPDYKSYMEMIRQKTSVLFGLSMQLGALFSDKDHKKFYDLGESIALSYQIRDDLLDITEKKGHDKGSDIKKGKKNIIYLKAKEKMDVSIYEEDPSDQDIEEFIKKLMQKCILDDIEKDIKRLDDKANDLLKSMTVTQEIEEFIYNLQNRSF